MHSLYIVAAILIWSSLGVFVRLLDTEVHIIIFYSVSFSLLFQSTMFLSSSIRRQIPSIRKIPIIALLSFVLLINTFTFLFAYSKTTIANAVFTHYIAPLVVAVLAYIFLKERISFTVILSIVIASAGLRIMLGGSTISDLAEEVFNRGIHLTPDLLGIASGLASGIAYAVLVILVRVFTQRFNHYVLVFFQNAFMAFFLLPFAEPVPLRTLWVFALMGAIHSTVAPFLYYRGLKNVEANRAAILGYLEPVGAIIFSMVFLSEYPDPVAIIGGALIILSGIIVVRERIMENRKVP